MQFNYSNSAQQQSYYLCQIVRHSLLKASSLLFGFLIQFQCPPPSSTYSKLISQVQKKKHQVNCFHFARRTHNTNWKPILHHQTIVRQPMVKAHSLLGSKSSDLHSAVKKKIKQTSKHNTGKKKKNQIGAFHHIYLLYLPDSFYWRLMWRLIQNPVPAINYFYIHVNYCSSGLQVFSAHSFH